MDTPPRAIVVAGTSSDIGKTTLVCDLLENLPGWEAIKLTRGHYRSCGKHTEACCVSHLLGSKPKVFSGSETRVTGKDTDRFWRAGASAVHWVVAANDQVEEGMRDALARVSGPGVVIEGTSLLSWFRADFAILVASALRSDIKPSARRALEGSRIDAIYFGDTEAMTESPLYQLDGTLALRVFNATTKDELIATALAKAGTTGTAETTRDCRDNKGR